MNDIPIYALDFDGVICDSAVETAMTGWKAASTIWPDMPKSAPDDLIAQFKQVRPILETGYEAIFGMRLLACGETPETIFADYHGKMHGLITEKQLSIAELKQLFGKTRDNWIAENLDEWLNMNPLFEGVAAKLQTLNKEQVWYIVTTKQERFVKHILQANAIDLPVERIFGLDRNMGKSEVLARLLKTHPDKPIHFVEDRLPTLINVASNPAVAGVEMQFAIWGYSTDEDKANAAEQPFKLLALDDFLHC